MKSNYNSKESLIELIKEKISENINLSSKYIDIDIEFYELGLDSLSSVSIVGDIEALLNIELEAEILWDYPTIRLLSEFIYSKINYIQT